MFRGPLYDIFSYRPVLETGKITPQKKHAMNFKMWQKTDSKNKS